VNRIRISGHVLYMSNQTAVDSNEQTQTFSLFGMSTVVSVIFISICLIFIGGVIYFFMRSRGNKKSLYWPITSELDTLPRTPAMKLRGSSYKSN